MGGLSASYTKGSLSGARSKEVSPAATRYAVSERSPTAARSEGSPPEPFLLECEGSQSEPRTCQQSVCQHSLKEGCLLSLIVGLLTHVCRAGCSKTCGD